MIIFYDFVDFVFLQRVSWKKNKYTPRFKLQDIEMLRTHQHCSIFFALSSPSSLPPSLPRVGMYAEDSVKVIIEIKRIVYQPDSQKNRLQETSKCLGDCSDRRVGILSTSNIHKEQQQRTAVGHRQQENPLPGVASVKNR